MLKKPESQKRILLIDDDQSVSQMLSMLLETRGYKVDVAYSGEEALQKVSSSIDLILLDLVLPDKEGLEVCHQIKENKATHNIPIIVLSAKLLSEDIVEALYLGADDYLTKPFDYDELVARMEAVMRRGANFQKNNFSGEGEESIVRELRKIIDEGLVTPFYQPIYLFRPFKLLGMEALCRPKTQSLLANPEMIFKAAMRYGFYNELELLSWRKAIENASNVL